MLEEVVIIGSGPAGHTAAIYLGRAERKPLMFEGFMAGGIAAGGQLTTTEIIENFPGFANGILGNELMEQMREQSLKSSARIITETVSSVDFSKHPFTLTLESGESVQAKSVIVATGATAKVLDIPGSKGFWQKGVSACAVCDGALPIFRNKTIAVIGGGDTAMGEAEHLSKFAKEVVLIHRRDKLRASPILQERIKNNPKIRIIWNSVPVELKGNKFLESAVLQNTLTNEKTELEISGLFYAIGHNPNTEFLGGQLELNEQGFVATKPSSTKTSVEGVFAAGDVQNPHYRQAVIAAGSGCLAALECEEYLALSI
ncbi:MAG: thioredoxin-disulfide reductase [Fibromonadaceae bacterium]|jgi:thioredoxin reductase (NADPH)|nr:thioredoxin-disulfide reductase [Fibromonadaceae bacterium]